MTSYFKFLEWWLWALDPDQENWLAMGDETVALENALVGNIEKRYPKKQSGWINSRWHSYQCA